MNEDYLANIRPSHRQLHWQHMEMYAFIHFGMNTMTDREWGLGNEDPELFDPDALDVDQWMDALASAGMTGVILTCKHHDGFCLWPSAYTDHTLASSPWKGGKGDLVREVSDSARRHGMEFGIYLSPWDRTERTYGEGKAYDDFYVGQLIELLTHYGPIFSVWLDGACGEGANGRKQTYDWQRYYHVIRALQPEAVISVCGPDVRWCGNEAGHTRANEWSVVPESLRSAELTASKSQHSDDGRFSRVVSSDTDDLGSRKALQGYTGPLAWYPAEVNTSSRHGWFHHPAEDGQVRSADEMFEIWCRSVGGNSTLLLNVPPNKHGLLAQSDVDMLRGLGQRIQDFKSRCITDGVHIGFSSNGDDELAERLLSPADDGSFWAPAADDGKPGIEIDFDVPRRVEAVVLREQIRQGQRIDRLNVYLDGHLAASAGSVGYQRILRFEPQTVKRVSVVITESRLQPTLALAVAVGG
ncbi:alpha-L-fucosidase [Bifidobacterium sp. ESL0764]|uniref:alpha-L-fucosidase n=1 Tax=Bifidobacterium sp. ESL0764 TaxID=2983228 RepID=UPI0023F78FD5|nr:alpha-L-fucosidase [Bifidobacterium sp. ESL0764]WEV66261.1 alpha-L-fucosidase [Bifidobacterium sp. ESL0764]